MVTGQDDERDSSAGEEPRAQRPGAEESSAEDPSPATSSAEAPAAEEPGAEDRAASADAEAAGADKSRAARLDSDPSLTITESEDDSPTAEGAAFDSRDDEDQDYEDGLDDSAGLDDSTGVTQSHAIDLSDGFDDSEGLDETDVLDRAALAIEGAALGEGANPSDAAKNSWGIAARCLALSGVLGMSLLLWAQFSFRGRWITPFILSNELAMPLRMKLLTSMFTAAGAGALIGALALVHAGKKGIPARRVERWLWFLSPLTFLGILPLFLRFLPWQDRHEALLPALLLVTLAFEACLLRALVATPGSIMGELQDIRASLPIWLKRHGASLVVVLGTVFYAVFVSFFMVRWHQKLGTGNFDLSINNNLLYGGLEGAFMQSTVVFPNDPAKYISNHVKLGGYLLLPIYAIFPRAETLLIAQSTFLACGALPLYGFARRYVGPWMAAVLALAWLCYYPMHSANFYEVNYVPMAAPFVMAVVWAADARRWVWCGVFFVVAALMREDVAVGLTVIGTFLLLSGHRPIAGLLMAGLASSWFVYLRFHVMDAAGEWWFPEMYKDLWAPGESGFTSVLKTLLTNPLFTLEKLLVSQKIFYLLHLLVPLAFLPARRWYLWAAFIPGGLLTFLATNYKPPTMFSFQYVMHWAPYMFMAAPLALHSMARDHRLGRIRAQAALGAVALATLVTTYNYGAFPRRDTLRAGYVRMNFDFTPEERQRYQQLVEFIKYIPKDASVAATEKLGPHVSSRRYFYSLRRGTHGAEYLLAREKELKLDKTRFHIGEGLKSGNYGVWKRSGEFVLMKKGYDTSGNQQLILEWGL